jgi:hypothetical protein
MKNNDRDFIIDTICDAVIFTINFMRVLLKKGNADEMKGINSPESTYLALIKQNQEYRQVMKEGVFELYKVKAETKSKIIANVQKKFNRALRKELIQYVEGI